MKKVLSILFLFLPIAMFGQIFLGDSYILNFDDSLQLQHLQFDSLSNQNNLWQIGPPQKNVFNGTTSFPNAIVTDTINVYPINDTSSFIIKNVTSNWGFIYPHTVTLEGLYCVNSDKKEEKSEKN